MSLALMTAMRPYQWAKGVFIFMPLVFGGRLFDTSALLRTVGVFVIFAMSSSAVYLINDCLDLQEDRQHPDKSQRPIASGKVPVRQAQNLAALLAVIAAPAAFLLDPRIGYVILSYFVLNALYMVFLKRLVVLDVFALGFMFYLRIVAGGFASEVMLSKWIVICSVLLALFLGFNKRRYDLEVLSEQAARPQGYTAYFLDRMIVVVAAAMIICYALYTVDAETVMKFGTQNLICTMPFVFYGIFRYIYLMEKKVAGGDPSRIFFSDRGMLTTVVLWIIACSAIIYF